MIESQVQLPGNARWYRTGTKNVKQSETSFISGPEDPRQVVIEHQMKMNILPMS
jgi:hypothetical protein